MQMHIARDAMVAPAGYDIVYLDGSLRLVDLYPTPVRYAIAQHVGVS
jgi:hypothetical protein